MGDIRPVHQLSSFISEIVWSFDKNMLWQMYIYETFRVTNKLIAIHLPGDQVTWCPVLLVQTVNLTLF